MKRIQAHISSLVRARDLEKKMLFFIQKKTGGSNTIKK
jgi:hypothetical protein